MQDYYYLDSNLKYAYYDGSTWHLETVDSSGDTGIRTSIALDSDDNPHISYQDWGNEDLWQRKRPSESIPDSEGLCFWWRRGRIELPVQRKNALSLLQAYPAVLSRPAGRREPEHRRDQSMDLWLLLSTSERPHPDLSAPIPHPPGGGESRRGPPS